MADLVDQLRQCVTALGDLLAVVEPEQWHAPTPCEGWDVRALAEHLVQGHRRVTTALGGAPGGEQDDGDLVASYRRTGDAMVVAFTVPGALDGVVPLTSWTVPGPVAAHLRITEALVHGWDLQQATGHRLAHDRAVVEQEIAFSRDALERLPDGVRPFGPPQPAPDDAPALDRLAALLGRAVG